MLLIFYYFSINITLKQINLLTSTSHFGILGLTVEKDVQNFKL